MLNYKQAGRDPPSIIRAHSTHGVVMALYSGGGGGVEGMHDALSRLVC